MSIKKVFSQRVFKGNIQITGSSLRSSSTRKVLVSMFSGNSAATPSPADRDSLSAREEEQRPFEERPHSSTTSQSQAGLPMRACLASVEMNEQRGQVLLQRSSIYLTCLYVFCFKILYLSCLSIYRSSDLYLPVHLHKISLPSCPSKSVTCPSKSVIEYYTHEC